MKQSGNQKTMTVAEYRKRKPSKYRNVKIEQDGELYDSKKEARRGRELTLMVKAGLIQELERQVAYPLRVEGVLICHYLADFRYVEAQGKQKGRSRVEDVKSKPTRQLPAYRIKKKLMAAIYGIEIIEV